MAEYIVEFPGEFSDGSTNDTVKEQIIRCHDCAHFDRLWTEQGWFNLCKRGGHLMETEYNGFCSSAKSKGVE